MTTAWIRYFTHGWAIERRRIVRRSLTAVGIVIFVSLMLLDVGSYFRACILSADGLKYSSYVLCGRGRIQAAHYFTGSLAFDRHPDWTFELSSPAKAWLSPTSIIRPVIFRIERATSDEENTVWFVSIPLWPPLILMAILLARALFVWRKHQRWRRSGCCIQCGYDLRGIAECCPECGIRIG